MAVTNEPLYIHHIGQSLQQSCVVGTVPILQKRTASRCETSSRPPPNHLANSLVEPSWIQIFDVEAQACGSTL